MIRVTSRLNQLQGYSSGSALKNHMESAHKGKFDLHCRACVELKLKGMDKSVSAKQ